MDMSGQKKQESLGHEDKHQRFVRVAERRTNELLEKIRILGNCSNKNTYAYTDEELSLIFAEVERALRTARGRFKPAKRSRFSLRK